MTTEEAAKDPKRKPANDGQIIPKRQNDQKTTTGKLYPKDNRQTTPKRQPEKPPKVHTTTTPKSRKAAKHRKPGRIRKASEPRKLQSIEGNATREAGTRKRHSTSPTERRKQPQPIKYPQKAQKPAQVQILKRPTASGQTASGNHRKAQNILIISKVYRQAKIKAIFPPSVLGWDYTPGGVSKSVAIFLKRKKIF